MSLFLTYPSLKSLADAKASPVFFALARLKIILNLMVIPLDLPLLILTECPRHLFKETQLGSLEKGKRADFVVLNKDYMTVEEEEIKNLYSVMTVVDGKIRY